MHWLSRVFGDGRASNGSPSKELEDVPQVEGPPPDSPLPPARTNDPDPVATAASRLASEPQLPRTAVTLSLSKSDVTTSGLPSLLTSSTASIQVPLPTANGDPGAVANEPRPSPGMTRTLSPAAVTRSTRPSRLTSLTTAPGARCSGSIGGRATGRTVPGRGPEGLSHARRHASRRGGPSGHRSRPPGRRNEPAQRLSRATWTPGESRIRGGIPNERPHTIVPKAIVTLPCQPCLLSSWSSRDRAS